MKKLLALFSLIALLTACATENSTLGNGQVDPIEAATIQVAVGLAMSAAPETIAPAYAVSTGLLNMLEGEQLVELSGLDTAIAAQLGELTLTAAERQSATELVALIRSKLRLELDQIGMPEDQRMVVVRAVVQIVHDAAAARLGVAQ